MRCAGLARRRARADVELGDLADRRGREEVVDEAGRLVDQRAVGLLRAGATSSSSGGVRRNAVGAEASSMSSSVASSVAATSVSRLRRPISGSAYLAAITSPCSVRRICAVAPCPAAAPGSPGSSARRRGRRCRRGRGTAAAGCRACAGVEQLHQRDLGAVQLPVAGEDSRRPCCCRSSRASRPARRRAPASMRAVHAAARRTAHDRRRGAAQVLDGLEQRHDDADEQVGAAPAPGSSRPTSLQQHAPRAGRSPPRMADDVVADRVRGRARAHLRRPPRETASSPARVLGVARRPARDSGRAASARRPAAARRAASSSAA